MLLLQAIPRQHKTLVDNENTENTRLFGERQLYLLDFLGASSKLLASLGKSDSMCSSAARAFSSICMEGKHQQRVQALCSSSYIRLFARSLRREVDQVADAKEDNGK